MVFESVLANTLLATIGTAAVISGISALAAETAKFDFRKFLFTIGIATVSGLAIVQTQFNGAITEDNFIPVFLAITGASMLGSKLFGVANKLK